MRVMVTRPQVSLGDAAPADDTNYAAKRADLVSPFNMFILGVVATLGTLVLIDVWKDNRGHR